MADTSGKMKFLFLIAFSLAIAVTVWLTLEKGAAIYAINPEPPPARQKIAALPPKPPAPTPIRVYSTKTALPPKPASAEDSMTVYKWVDEQGTIHFSDQPHHSGAEQVKVSPIQAYKLPESKPANRSQALPGYQPYGQSAPAVRETRVISASDYDIFSNARQKDHRTVELSGRVSSGPECQALQLMIRAENNQGRSVSARTVVENVGWGSSLFEATRSSAWRDNTPRPIWRITEITGFCRD